MVEWRRILVAVVAALVATAAVQADLTSVGPSGAERVDRACALACDEQRPMDSFTSLGISSGFDLDLRSIAPSVSTTTEPEQPAPPANLVILTDRSDSVDLCLYALLGLGLCRSGQLVKKSGLAFIPDWYHHGGPLQIGHSYAVGPDCLGSNLACFIQPNATPEDLQREHHQGPIAPLLHKSLFTPTVRASRGPPSMS